MNSAVGLPDREERAMETRSAWTPGVRYGMAALLLFIAVPLWAQADTAGAAAAGAEIDSAGYPVPSLDSYSRDDEKVANLDAVSFVPGAETLAEPFTSPDGKMIARFTTGGVVWGYSVLATPRDATSLYFLRDPTCSGVYTEKLKPGDPFGPPVCAAEAARAQAEGGDGAPAGEAPVFNADSGDAATGP